MKMAVCDSREFNTTRRGVVVELSSHERDKHSASRLLQHNLTHLSV